MTLRTDTARALRTHEQLVSLVRDVVAAAAADESRAIEWKSGYDDLRAPEASFAIARAIIGLANRPVDVSASAFEGVGYVIIGAEPGSLAGQSVPDSAELLNALRRYTGHTLPLWDHRAVQLGDVSVLVITVEPPRPGDRIAVLRKSFQPLKGALVPEGTIFVRQPGATERASRQDLEMLQDRLLAGANAAESARVAARNEHVRRHVAKGVGAAHRWAEQLRILVIATGQRRWAERDWVEYFETDSGRDMVADATAMKDSVSQLRLLVSDVRLLQALEHAVTVQQQSNAFDQLHNGSLNAEARAIAYRHLNGVDAAWDAVEAAAITLVSDR